MPVATALINDTPLPDLAPDNVELWIGDEPPDGNGLKLLDASDTAHEAHLDAHLAPLIAAVNAATKRPAKRAVARREGPPGRRDRLDRRDHQPARRAPSSCSRPSAELRMLDLGTHEMLLHVREGCCLYYRTPANVKCFSCPLLDDEERRRLSGAT